MGHILDTTMRCFRAIRVQLPNKGKFAKLKAKLEKYLHHLMEHFLIVKMQVQYKGLYSSQSCYLEGTHLIFYALKYTYHLILMALKQTNKKTWLRTDINLRNCTSTGQKFERNAIYIGRKFEQMGPKKCQMNHDNSFDKNIPDANSQKIIQSKRFCLLL